MIESPQTWNRQEGEGTKPFRAFTVYLAMGADRSLVKVGQKLGVSKTIIERYSSRFGWMERARAYDAHLSELRLERLASARERLADEQIALAAKMFSIVKAKMNGLRNRKLDAHGIARLFTAASQAIQNVFGDERPLSETPPKIVFVRLARNQPRDFDEDAKRRGDLVM